MTNGKWANMTVVTAEMIGNEYPKTFGHYHTKTINETTRVLIGEGIYQIQKKHFNTKGEWVHNMVDAVYLVKGEPGDEILTTPDYAHSWTNVGKYPLVTYDDWRSGHTELDYEQIEKLHGMAYYITSKNGTLELVPNQAYKDLPPPKIVSAKNYAELVGLS